MNITQLLCLPVLKIFALPLHASTHYIEVKFRAFDYNMNTARSHKKHILEAKQIEQNSWEYWVGKLETMCLTLLLLMTMTCT